VAECLGLRVREVIEKSAEAKTGSGMTVPSVLRSSGFPARLSVKVLKYAARS
jgi:hypothetical protein